MEKRLIAAVVAVFGAVSGCASEAPEASDVREDVRDSVSSTVAPRVYNTDCEAGHRLFNCSACGSWMCVTWDVHGECDGWYWLGGGNTCALPSQNPNPSCCYMQ